jgi:hypothetical protein
MVLISYYNVQKIKNVIPFLDFEPSEECIFNIKSNSNQLYKYIVLSIKYI